jgi:hypothetical protein
MVCGGGGGGGMKWVRKYSECTACLMFHHVSNFGSLNNPNLPLTSYFSLFSNSFAALSRAVTTGNRSALWRWAF